MIPYMFTSRGDASPWRRSQRRTLAASSASPPKTTRRIARAESAGALSSARTKCRKAEGVWLSTVTPSPATSARKASGDLATQRGTTTSRPPKRSAPHISHTEKSNAGEWKSVHTSSGPKRNRSAVASNRRATQACVTTTPFGVPVEPDV